MPACCPAKEIHSFEVEGDIYLKGHLLQKQCS